MSKALVAAPVEHHLTAMQWTSEQVDLVKRTICKDATDDELKLFMHICKRTGLDPFARQIYANKRKNNKTGIAQMVVQTSIDGYRLIANRTDAYAGSDDPVYDDEKSPNKATVTVYKMVQGQRCPFTATARWSEYCPKQGDDFMWQKMPCLMLGKVAEALALRKAFPADLSGIYTKEEMDQAGGEVPSGPSTLPANSPLIGVKPGQPGPEDGFKPAHYTGVFGKYRNKSLEEVERGVGLEQIAKDIEGIPRWLNEKGRPLTDEIKEQLERMGEYIGKRETEMANALRESGSE